MKDKGIMKNSDKFRAILCIVGAAIVMLLIVCGVMKVSINNAITTNQLQPQIKADKIASQIEGALAEQGWDLNNVHKESIIPTTFCDGQGNTITFYVYNTTNMDYNDEQPIIYEVFDPGTADCYKGCKVNEIDAVLYQKGKRSYLWWAPDTKTILLIEYEHDAVDETEIMKMAESVRAVS